MFKVSTESYAEMLKIHYDSKIPLLVMGGPGIGKSAIPRAVFKEMATEKGRTFSEWAHMSAEQKADANANPDKWFVMVDLRMSQLDTSDLRGIPRLTGESMEYAPMSWLLYYEKPTADGVIFFDEINQAAPIVTGQCFQAILDRVISDRKVSDNVYMFAAGNRASDKAQVFNMPFPLKDRFAEIELSLNDDAWCKWAMENGINPHLIAFIKWKPSALYSPPKGSEDKGSTPRGVARASKILENCKELDSPLAHTLVCASTGENFGTEFAAYVAVASAIDFEMLLKNPKKVKDLTSMDKKFAICGLLGEHIAKTQQNDKERLSGMFAIVHNLPTEFAVVALNMIRTGCPGGNAVFKRIITFYPDHKSLISTAAKFAM